MPSVWCFRVKHWCAVEIPGIVALDFCFLSCLPFAQTERNSRSTFAPHEIRPGKWGLLARIHQIIASHFAFWGMRKCKGFHCFPVLFRFLLFIQPMRSHLWLAHFLPEQLFWFTRFCPNFRSFLPIFTKVNVHLPKHVYVCVPVFWSPVSSTPVFWRLANPHHVVHT